MIESRLTRVRSGMVAQTISADWIHPRRSGNPITALSALLGRYTAK